MNTCRDSKSMLSRNDNHVVGRGTGKLVNDTAGRAKHGHTMLQTARKEVKKTHYPYKEPRIDQKMYQAEIPPLQGRNSSRASTRGSSPRAGEGIFLLGLQLPLRCSAHLLSCEMDASYVVKTTYALRYLV